MSGSAEGGPGSDPTGGLGVPGEDRDRLLDALDDAAYRWAAGGVEDRDVLVIGSGRGHGAALLQSAGARSVVGVEVDGRDVDVATGLYGDRVRFLRAEPMALPLATGAFDAVVCFGPLEATQIPGAVLGEIHRVLSSEGLLLATLRLASDSTAEADPLEGDVRSRFANVRSYRRRACLGAVVAPAGDGASRLDEAAWLAGDPGEDRTTLLAASNRELPDLDAVASLISMRDLGAQEATIEAWEQRARRAEADGSAKHWELVASREGQRRLRKRLYELEHRPLRVLSRILRGKPRKLGLGPPMRVSERPLDRWE